jgi:hypothetical protein
METAWKKSDGPVRYCGGEVTAQLGDRIELHGLLRKRRGVLNYVPGISVPHPEMEHDALYWVGIALDNGIFTGVLVDPETGCTLKRLVFAGRGSMDGVAPVPEAPFD